MCKLWSIRTYRCVEQLAKTNQPIKGRWAGLQNSSGCSTQNDGCPGQQYSLLFFTWHDEGKYFICHLLSSVPPVPSMDLSMNGWMDVNQRGSHNIFVATDSLHFDMWILQHWTISDLTTIIYWTGLGTSNQRKNILYNLLATTAALHVYQWKQDSAISLLSGTHQTSTIKFLLLWPKRKPTLTLYANLLTISFPR